MCKEKPNSQIYSLKMYLWERRFLFEIILFRLCTSVFWIICTNTLLDRMYTQTIFLRSHVHTHKQLRSRGGSVGWVGRWKPCRERSACKCTCDRRLLVYMRTPDPWPEGGKPNLPRFLISGARLPIGIPFKQDIYKIPGTVPPTRSSRRWIYATRNRTNETRKLHWTTCVCPLSTSSQCFFFCSYSALLLTVVTLCERCYVIWSTCLGKG